MQGLAVAGGLQQTGGVDDTDQRRQAWPRVSRPVHRSKAVHTIAHVSLGCSWSSNKPSTLLKFSLVLLVRQALSVLVPFLRAVSPH